MVGISVVIATERNLKNLRVLKNSVTTAGLLTRMGGSSVDFNIY